MLDQFECDFLGAAAQHFQCFMAAAPIGALLYKVAGSLLLALKPGAPGWRPLGSRRLRRLPNWLHYARNTGGLPVV